MHSPLELQDDGQKDKSTGPLWHRGRRRMRIIFLIVIFYDYFGSSFGGIEEFWEFRIFICLDAYLEF